MPSWAEKDLTSVAWLSGLPSRWRDDGDVAVGEDAVDVVEQDFDAAGAGFGGESGHELMILGGGVGSG